MSVYKNILSLRRKKEQNCKFSQQTDLGSDNGRGIKQRRCYQLKVALFQALLDVRPMSSGTFCPAVLTPSPHLCKYVFCNVKTAIRHKITDKSEIRVINVYTYSNSAALFTV